MSPLYTLLHITDSFFPSGAFAHSYGLEGLLANGAGAATEVRSAMVAAIWEHHLLRADGLLGLCAHRAMAAGRLASVCDLDRQLVALKLPRELREASLATGRGFLAEASVLLPSAALRQLYARVESGDSPGNYAIVFQAAAASAGVTAADALLAWGYQTVAQLAAALLRLGLIGHRAAAALVGALRPAVEDGVRHLLADAGGGVSSFAPLLEIASMRHERQYSRLFRS